MSGSVNLYDRILNIYNIKLEYPENSINLNLNEQNLMNLIFSKISKDTAYNAINKSYIEFILRFSINESYLIDILKENIIYYENNMNIVTGSSEQSFPLKNTKIIDFDFSYFASDSIRNYLFYLDIISEIYEYAYQIKEKNQKLNFSEIPIKYRYNCESGSCLLFTGTSIGYTNTVLKIEGNEKGDKIINIFIDSQSSKQIMPIIEKFKVDIINHLNYLKGDDVTFTTQYYIRDVVSFFKLCKLKLCYCIANSIYLFSQKETKNEMMSNDIKTFIIEYVIPVFINFKSRNSLNIPKSNDDIYSYEVINKSNKLKKLNREIQLKKDKMLKNKKHNLKIKENVNKQSYIHLFIKFLLVTTILLSFIFLNLNFNINVKTTLIIFTILIIIILYISLSYLLTDVESFEASDANLYKNVIPIVLTKSKTVYHDGKANLYYIKTFASSTYKNDHLDYAPFDEKAETAWRSDENTYFSGKAQYNQIDSSYMGEYLTIDTCRYTTLNRVNISYSEDNCGPKSFSIFGHNNKQLDVYKYGVFIGSDTTVDDTKRFYEHIAKLYSIKENDIISVEKVSDNSTYHHKQNFLKPEYDNNKNKDKAFMVDKHYWYIPYVGYISNFEYLIIDETVKAVGSNLGNFWYWYGSIWYWGMYNGAYPNGHNAYYTKKLATKIEKNKDVYSYDHTYYSYYNSSPFNKVIKNNIDIKENEDLYIYIFKYVDKINTLLIKKDNVSYNNKQLTFDIENIERFRYYTIVIHEIVGLGDHVNINKLEYLEKIITDNDFNNLQEEEIISHLIDYKPNTFTALERLAPEIRDPNSKIISSNLLIRFPNYYNYSLEFSKAIVNNLKIYNPGVYYNYGNIYKTYTVYPEDYPSNGVMKPSSIYYYMINDIIKDYDNKKELDYSSIKTFNSINFNKTNIDIISDNSTKKQLLSLTNISNGHYIYLYSPWFSTLFNITREMIVKELNDIIQNQDILTKKLKDYYINYDAMLYMKYESNVNDIKNEFQKRNGKLLLLFSKLDDIKNKNYQNFLNKYSSIKFIYNGLMNLSEKNENLYFYMSKIKLDSPEEYFNKTPIYLQVKYKRRTGKDKNLIYEIDYNNIVSEINADIMSENADVSSIDKEKYLKQIYDSAVKRLEEIKKEIEELNNAYLSEKSNLETQIEDKLKENESILENTEEGRTLLKSRLDLAKAKEEEAKKKLELASKEAELERAEKDLDTEKTLLDDAQKRRDALLEIQKQKMDKFKEYMNAVEQSQYASKRNSDAKLAYEIALSVANKELSNAQKQIDLELANELKKKTELEEKIKKANEDKIRVELDLEETLYRNKLDETKKQLIETQKIGLNESIVYQKDLLDKALQEARDAQISRQELENEANLFLQQLNNNYDMKAVNLEEANYELKIKLAKEKEISAQLKAETIESKNKQEQYKNLEDSAIKIIEQYDKLIEVLEDNNEELQLLLDEQNQKLGNIQNREDKIKEEFRKALENEGVAEIIDKEDNRFKKMDYETKLQITELSKEKANLLAEHLKLSIELNTTNVEELKEKTKKENLINELQIQLETYNKLSEDIEYQKDLLEKYDFIEIIKDIDSQVLYNLNRNIDGINNQIVIQRLRKETQFFDKYKEAMKVYTYSSDIDKEVKKNENYGLHAETHFIIHLCIIILILQLLWLNTNIRITIMSGILMFFIALIIYYVNMLRRVRTYSKNYYWEKVSEKTNDKL